MRRLFVLLLLAVVVHSQAPTTTTPVCTCSLSVFAHPAKMNASWWKNQSETDSAGYADVGVYTPVLRFRNPSLCFNELHCSVISGTTVLKLTTYIMLGNGTVVSVPSNANDPLPKINCAGNEWQFRSQKIVAGACIAIYQ